MPKTLRVAGFTTPQSAHAHLLKHVLRVTEVSDPESEPTADPEGWAEVMPNPPLVADLGRRRSSASSALANVRGCIAGEMGPTGEKPCSRCQDRSAINVVSKDMTDLLSRYVGAGQAALDAAFSNPDKHGPRLVAYRGPQGRSVETVDSRHVRMVGRITVSGEVELVTCFRDRSRTLGSWWLELARLRAAHRRAGTLELLG